MSRSSTLHTPPADAGAGVRRRMAATVFGAVAFGATGVFATITAAPLVALDLTGSEVLSGVPAAAVVVGSVGGAMGISMLMARRGRRVGLAAGYFAGAVGALIAMLAVITMTFPSYLLGILLVGVANSAVMQSRFVVADVYPVHQRTRALALVLWGAAIGAVVGPNIVAPAAVAAAAAGLAPLSGSMAFVALAFGVCSAGCGALLPPTSHAEANRAASRPVPSKGGRRTVDWSSPVLAVALAVMVVGQLVLVVIQTATPVHVGSTGAGLGVVGAVMSSHVLGMYALTPAAGWLADRVGHGAVMVAGLATLACAGMMSAVASTGSVETLAAPLFLVGVGWSFGFVSASGLLTLAASLSERARVQGAADTLVFTAAACASIASGVVMSAGGFATLCISAAVLALAPIVIIARHRGAVRLVLGPQP